MVTDGNVCAPKPAGLTEAYPVLARLSPLCIVAGSSTSIKLTGNNLFEKSNELVRDDACAYIGRPGLLLLLF